MPKVAIVTGGAGGLGRFLTRRLCGTGAHVVVADIDARAGRQLVDMIEVEGGEATFVSTDASDANEVQSLVRQAAELGELEVLINNAGGWLPGPQFPDGNRWFQSLDLNLRMPMLATQLCLPLMEAGGGGAVVNVASSGGLEPVGYPSPEYAAAKAGLIRFTTAVRDAALRRKVRVSCIVPHWIGLDRAVQEFEQMSPEQRADSGGLVRPETIADVVLHLSQDPQAAGRVVVLRPGHEPYDINPAAADPLWSHRPFPLAQDR
jgi:NAD(P)-dependent dehydrogenase (short-subunit alcohol dehydrogenase family)